MHQVKTEILIAIVKNVIVILMFATRKGTALPLISLTYW